MSNAHYGDVALTKLRAMVAVINQEMAHAPPSPGLKAAWAELVETLALQPADETRECPACHAIGMRAASRCGECWTALAPMAPLATAAEAVQS
ncbi:MAG TPA: hypothetical protein VIV40_06100 [Kofleriaceae bacterium]